MNDDIEELIKEIAAKHGIAVSRDDPILVLQTINRRLIEDSSKAQQMQLDRYKEELEDLAARWGSDARNKAERILNAALLAGKEVMDQQMNDGAKALALAVRTEIDASLAGVADRARDAKRVAIFNVVAACITLLAAGVALWVALLAGAAGPFLPFELSLRNRPKMHPALFAIQNSPLPFLFARKSIVQASGCQKQLSQSSGPG